MPNLLSSLLSSANALSVFERALLVSQNNIANISTPGYAAQRLTLEPLDLNPSMGLIGGVRAGDVVSARNQYADAAVRRQVESLGLHEQQTSSLSALEAVFAISGTSSIPGALNRLYDSFSAWSLTPNSPAARETVLGHARELAESFQQTAASLANVSTDADRQLRETVDAINNLGEKLQTYNIERRRSGLNDPGLDAKIQTALEGLAELTDFNAIYQSDGSVTVLLGGQTPLVIGDRLNRISVSFYTPSSPPPTNTSAPPSAHILNTDGAEITAQLTQGRLGGLLDFRNRQLAELRGDAYQPGGLNVLAQGVADRINTILSSGRISDGPPPVAGVPLFTYDASSATLAAQSLAVDPALTPDRLAAIDPGPPYTGNGIALRLAALADPLDAADTIGGSSFTEYYGELAAKAGRALEDARNNKEFKSQMVTQARSLRDELSGVSLDEEAVHLVEFQRAYQAAARFVSVLDNLTETTVNLLR